MTVIAGSFPFQIIAGGTNFAPGAVLKFNGVAQNTSVAPSAQNAYAVISTTAISTPGTVQVTVTNPAPGGGVSNAEQFLVSDYSYGSVPTQTVKAGKTAVFEIPLIAINGFNIQVTLICSTGVGVNTAAMPGIGLPW